VQLRVTYPEGSGALAGGERLSRVATAAKPEVALLGADPAAFYTLIMVDPDAPDPATPVRKMSLTDALLAMQCAHTRCALQTFRSWLHWLVVDVPGDAAPAAGRTLTQYKGPSPPSGVHRCGAAVHALASHHHVCCEPNKRDSLRASIRAQLRFSAVPAGGRRRGRGARQAACAARAQLIQRACARACVHVHYALLISQHACVR
jgi:phosphatidylethanolamine-binding protein (PEBP) family uncharacterized protein